MTRFSYYLLYTTTAKEALVEERRTCDGMNGNGMLGDWGGVGLCEWTSAVSSCSTIGEGGDTTIPSPGITKTPSSGDRTT